MYDIFLLILFCAEKEGIWGEGGETGGGCEVR